MSLSFFLNKNKIKFLLAALSIFPISVLALEDNYISQFINQSKNDSSQGYTLVKTRVWPESGCVLESGAAVVHPGESTQLIIAKKKECDQAGIGYSMYKVEDSHHSQLLGYVSHRFRDGQFSLQVSVFCQNNQCIFKDLNPQQDRKS